jgi:hypothetical protein
MPIASAAIAKYFSGSGRERLGDRSHFVLVWVVALLSLLGAGFIAVRMALRKRYRGFTIQIIREMVS